MFEKFDKSRILSGSFDKSIKIWDIASASCIKTIILAHSSTIKSFLKFSKTKFISGGSSIKFWDKGQAYALKL